MQTVLLVVLVLAGFGLVGLVLLQQGKGADAGAAFGSGASSTVFGSRGSGSFMTKSTSVLATVFFVSCLLLAYLSSQKVQQTSVVDTAVTPAESPAESLEQASSEVPADMPKDVPEDVPMMPSTDSPAEVPAGQPGQ